jgi:NADH dehydrogenase FAD-containing subunit/uncharacterized membrane protein YphA (DoxX/SURF4 family)
MSGVSRARLSALLGFARGVLAAAAPFVDLWVRLCLARVFFVSGMLKVGNWQTALELARHEYPVTWLDPHTAAVLGATVEVAGSVLLAIGLLVRPAALGMLVLSLVIQFAFQHLDINLVWAAMFGWYVVRGPGPLSLDRALANGLRNSALPLASQAIEAGERFAGIAGPLYQLALRLWLATSLAGLALPPAFFPTATAAMVPRIFGLMAAVCLALGAGTPLVAGALMTILSGVWMMSQQDGLSLYAPLLFALLGIYGAGALSLDRVLLVWIGRRASAGAALPHVVIVGGGFGGLACAAGLRHDRVRVTLIDRRNYHLFQPLLYQVATANLSPGDIATPIRAVFRDDPTIAVLRGTVTGVDASHRTVLMGDRAIKYDYLVLATGASHGYFGHDEWAVHAPGLKFVDDAVAMRGRILGAFERAEATDDPAERESLLTFLICGGGPTGVELAGAIAELARHGLKKEFRNFDPAAARIILVQSGPRILPPFPEKLSWIAHASLERLGVQVMVGSRVEAIDEDGVIVNGKRIAASTVLWAAGVVASPSAEWLKQKPDPAGRLKVTGDLSVPGLPNVFAVGDTALALAWKGLPVPGLASAAKQGGAYVAAVLRARLEGRPPPLPFLYRHRGSLVTIGRKSAVADFGWIRLWGAVAWWLWGTVHVLFLVGVRNRLSVVVGWMWSYFTYGVGVRLITDDGERPVDAARNPSPTPRKESSG